MLSNQLSRYGAISRNIPALAPGAKLFLVSDSDDTTVGPFNLGNEFPVDVDGVVRVYTTIQAAVNASSAGRGDVVLVLPGYDQSLTAADSWNVASTQVIGYGNGNNRPTIRMTGTAGRVRLGASNVRASNLRFLTAVDSGVQGVQIDSGFTGVTIDNCLWDFNATTNDFRVMLRVGSPRSLIEDNRFIGEDTAGTGRAISFIGAAAYSTYRRNYFYGQFDTVGDTTNGAAVIAMDTTDTTDTNVSGLVFKDNEIVSTDTAVAMYFRMDTSSTIRGIATNNKIVSYDSGTVDSSKLASGTSVKGGLRFVRNWVISADSATEKLFGDTCPAN